MRYAFWQWNREAQEHRPGGEANCPDDVPREEQEEFYHLWLAMTRPVSPGGEEVRRG